MLSEIIQKIKNDAVERLKKEGTTASNLFIDERIINAGDKIIAGTDEIAVYQDTIMVFVDDDPEYNWSHPCRYFLYDALKGGFLKQVDAGFPPYMFDIPATYLPFYKQVVHEDSDDNKDIKNFPDS